MDNTYAYGPTLSYLSKEDQQKYSAEFKRYLQKAWREDATPKEWNGYYFLPAHEPATAQCAYNEWNPNEGDVIVASYPKTGDMFVRLYCYVGQHVAYPNQNDFSSLYIRVFTATINT